MTVAPVSLKKPRPPTTLMVDPNGSDRVAIGQLQVDGKITARLMTWTWLEITELKHWSKIKKFKVLLPCPCPALDILLSTIEAFHAWKLAASNSLVHQTKHIGLCAGIPSTCLSPCFW